MATPKAALPALVCLGLLLGGCGAPGASTPQAAVSAEPSAESVDGGPVPESLIEILRRGEHEVDPGTFDDGGISAEEAVSRFNEDYAPDTFGDDVTVYAAVIRKSASPALPTGLAVRVLHIPDVPQAIEGPSPQGGAPSHPDTVMTDLVAFFDARSGKFYETSFIGQPAGQPPDHATGDEDVACTSPSGVADYFGSGGSFDSPEAALAVALQGVGVPISDYTFHQGDDDQGEYRYIGDTWGSHVWEMRLEPEGWQVYALSGCLDVLGMEGQGHQPTDLALLTGEWFDAQGNVVSDVGRQPDLKVSTSLGPEHCEWQSVVFLTVVWPLGTENVPEDGTPSRQYLRDPEGVVAPYEPDPGEPPGTRGEFDMDADLPRSATYSGFHTEHVELWFGPDHGDEWAYLVMPDRTERWPRENPTAGCD